MTAAPRRPAPAWARRTAGLVQDLRGGVRLAVDGLHGLIGRVETVHQRMADLRPPVRGRIGRPGTGLPALVYRGLRGGADLLGGGLDIALASMQASLQDPLRERDVAPPLTARENSLAALNALAGDHLHRTGNPLAIATTLRVDGPVRGRVVVLVHDFGRSDRQWRRAGRDFGVALADELGATAAYARYNSGRHVWSTARELAAELEALLASWREPLQGVALVGHGLGGLVARSALHQAVRSGRAWPAHVQQLVFLGTPHAGAERIGWRFDGLDGAAAWALARLARRDSDGLADLLSGNLLEHDPRTGQPLQPDPLPVGLEAFAIAGGADALVPVNSALGRHPDGQQDLGLPEPHRWTAEGVDHLGLLANDEVLRRVRDWLASGGAGRAQGRAGRADTA